MNRSLLVAGLLYGCGWSIIDEIRIPRIRLQLVAIVAPFIGSKNNECDTQRSVKFSAQLSRDTNTIQKICYANNHQFSSGVRAKVVINDSKLFSEVFGHRLNINAIWSLQCKNIEFIYQGVSVIIFTDAFSLMRTLHLLANII